MRIADSCAESLIGDPERWISAAMAEPAGIFRRSESSFACRLWHSFGCAQDRAALRQRLARTAFTVLLLLLTGTAGWGQSHGQAKVATDSKEDIKQAQQLADRGDKSFASGRMNEALAEYEQAVKRAPGDAGIVRRAAAMRAEVVQKLVDQAETDALDGFVVTATDLMYEALRIDPGNTIVAERLAQMKQMKEYLPRGDKEDYEMRAAAALKPQQGKKAINARGDSKSAYQQVAGMFGI